MLYGFIIITSVVRWWRKGALNCNRCIQYCGWQWCNSSGEHFYLHIFSVFFIVRMIRCSWEAYIPEESNILKLDRSTFLEVRLECIPRWFVSTAAAAAAATILIPIVIAIALTLTSCWPSWWGSEGAQLQWPWPREHHSLCTAQQV